MSIIQLATAEQEGSLPEEYSYPNYNLITKNLYLGSIPEVGEAKLFKHLVCVTDVAPYYALHERVVTWAPFRDILQLPPVEFLHRIADQVQEHIEDGPTLVHCTAGLNRSAMIVALVLIKQGWAPHRAIAHLRQTRGEAVLHNKLFHDWLMSLYQAA